MNTKQLYESIMKNVAKQVKKTLNEGFNENLKYDLFVLIENFDDIDMERFYDVAIKDDEYVPSLQRILNKYDGYVIDVIECLINPNLRNYEKRNNIVEMAEDNEWNQGTEPEMVMEFLQELYNWCERHNLQK